SSPKYNHAARVMGASCQGPCSALPREGAWGRALGGALHHIRASGVRVADRLARTSAASDGLCCGVAIPRWLSDARVVESRMGWPPRLSRSLVSNLDARNFAGDAMQLWPLTVVAGIIGVGASFALMCGVAGGLP